MFFSEFKVELCAPESIIVRSTQIDRLNDNIGSLCLSFLYFNAVFLVKIIFYKYHTMISSKISHCVAVSRNWSSVDCFSVNECLVAIWASRDAEVDASSKHPRSSKKILTSSRD